MKEQRAGSAAEVRVVGAGWEDFQLAVSLALQDEKVRAWSFGAAPQLVLHWSSAKGTQVPFPLPAESAARFAWDWFLSLVDWPSHGDGDGSYSKGFLVARASGVEHLQLGYLCIIQPHWLYYGK